MAFVTDKTEIKPVLILFRRGDVDHRMWYCRMKIHRADRYETVSLKTTDFEVARERAFDQDADIRFRLKHDVSVYREEERTFSVGDRVQLTAPARELGVANRELGTITRIEDEKRIALKMEDGRQIELHAAKHPHLDHGYAVTSHSSQGQTAERGLVHVDTELGAKDLLNNRMAYVAISRGAHDAQIFTNDREKLPLALGHDVSHQSAHAPQANLEKGLAAEQSGVKAQFDHGLSM
jgi:ATP-dependent exoDNAse (exonuclease V) alpha subunit